MMRLILFGIFSLILSTPAWSYYTVQDTAELVPAGSFLPGVELQGVTSPNSGANLVGRLDGAFDDEFGYRAILGFGEVDFQIGSFIKWAPIPDINQQPAISFVAGALIAEYEDHTEFSLRFWPLVSKRFGWEKGELTPYAALPIGWRNYDDKTDTPVQLVLGTRYVHPELKGVHWYGEFGAKLDNSVAYISIGASFYMDEDNYFDIHPEDRPTNDSLLSE